ncbi:MAG TPA: fluoride efflux transporter CrcB [Flavisolibacter sp.]|nr:fluoride efflux transporter CrcB [Flavisolibacter sp.]
MFNNILLVGLGGGVGSILRYLCQRSLNARFPYGTFVVNIVGCLIIGLLWGYFSRHTDESRRLLLVTGFCGGFTTFSSFTYEGVQMMTDNRWLVFAFYIAISVFTGLLATWAGYKLTN